MRHQHDPDQLALAANQNIKEREYWLNTLAGDWEKSRLPFDFNKMAENGYRRDAVKFHFSPELLCRVMNLSGGVDIKLHMILLAGLTALIYRYTGNADIVVGSPILKQEAEADFINTILVFRNRLPDHLNFKELLLQVRETIIAATENQNFPLEILPSLLNIPGTGDGFALFDIVLLLENLHERSYLRGIDYPLLFSFCRQGDGIGGTIEYNALLYEQKTIGRLRDHFCRLLEKALADVDAPLSGVDFLSSAEKRQLLVDFNHNGFPFSDRRTIVEIFETQVTRTPQNTAIVVDKKLKSESPRQNRSISFKHLDEKANQLAVLLRSKGVKPESMAAMLVEDSIEMIIGILGIWKAGGAYLPIDGDTPPDRIAFLLGDAGTGILLTCGGLADGLRFQGEKIDLEAGGIYTAVPTRPDIPVGMGNLAYAIYTSGSSGSPRAVLVEHGNLAANIDAFFREFDIQATDTVIQLASYAFDAFIEEVFPVLLRGGKVAIPGKHAIVDIPLLSEFIARYGVTIIDCTPLLLNEFNRLDGLAGVHTFISGGDVLKGEYVNHLLAKGKVYNTYGPTEATVCTTYYRLNSHGPGAAVPIGRPIANYRVYILDRNGRLLPLHAVGELCVAGAGISRGYLNKPELTADKFVDLAAKTREETRSSQNQPLNPESQILYRTGDLARWLPDGNIEFMGRIDQQVKIRGYRIELGEIESTLLRLDDIKEAVVIDRSDDKGNKYLCAYFVSAREFTLAELRESLCRRLPEYLVPSFFIRLGRLPLTVSGKVDRKALPGPEGMALGEDVEYVLPGDEVEKKLVEIWQRVLGRDKIGIHENFFMIGGDSIKAIQIAARMRTAGYKVEMRDIFLNQSIAELAPSVKPIEAVPDQAVVTGKVPLTPIQRDFFKNCPLDPHHFNQAAMLYSREGFEEEAIKAVFRMLLQHHDALRMTYSEEGGEIIQFNHGPAYPLSLEVFDLRQQAAAADELRARANEIQASIDLERGPLLKLGLFHLDDGDRLLIVIHHLVVDGVSWRILFEDMETLFRQHREAVPFQLPLKTDSFKNWSEKLSAYADSEPSLKEKAYWQEIESMEIPAIEGDNEVEENLMRDVGRLAFELSREETKRLLTEVNDAFGTEINDILLTALALSVREFSHHHRLLVALEGHGREEILENVEVSRTVGWFTTVYPVVLEVGGTHDLSRRLKEVKESLRRVPNRGIGYGILKWLTSEKHKTDIDFTLRPQVGFNYLGQFDEDVKGESFSLAGESVGGEFSPNTPRAYALDITGIIAGGRLQIVMAYNKNQFRPETIQELLDLYKNQLDRIVVYCSTRKEGELTPSDLTYNSLSIDDLEEIAALFDK